jgi:hypothetical protein
MITPRLQSQTRCGDKSKIPFQLCFGTNEVLQCRAQITRLDGASSNSKSKSDRFVAKGTRESSLLMLIQSRREFEKFIYDCFSGHIGHTGYTRKDTQNLTINEKNVSFGVNANDIRHPISDIRLIGYRERSSQMGVSHHTSACG